MDSDFLPTRWTLVLRARGEGETARAALSDLCAAYYEPVVGFLRRDGRSEDEAREVAHAFFERLLAGGLGAPDPGRGRFRSYLLGALKHFLSKHRASALAAKRGGGEEHVSWAEEGDSQPGMPFPGGCDDTLHFDREWALAIIGRALDTLEREHAGKPHLFEARKPWLDGSASRPQAEAATALGMSGTAVKVAIHRLRARFGELIRAEVAATVDSHDDVAEELRHLIVVAGRG